MLLPIKSRDKDHGQCELPYCKEQSYKYQIHSFLFELNNYYFVKIVVIVRILFWSITDKL